MKMLHLVQSNLVYHSNTTKFSHEVCRKCTCSIFHLNLGAKISRPWLHGKCTTVWEVRSNNSGLSSHRTVLILKICNNLYKLRVIWCSMKKFVNENSYMFLCSFLKCARSFRDTLYLHPCFAFKKDLIPQKC